ncbi:MAG TPA: CHAD domain-containing protein, partial [Stellaceae bacterium]
DMPAEDALAAIVRRSLEHMLANDPAALAGDAEGVHQMRVALRRLRATLGLFKTLIPDAQRAQATAEMKWLADALGAARNWDIFAVLAAPVQQALPEDGDLAALLRAVEEKRRAAYAAMREVMTSARYTDMVLRLMEWVEMRGWRQQQVSETSVLLLSPVGDLADGLVEKRYRKARKLAKRFAALDAAGRHELRIALKKLRYGADSFEPMYPAKAAARMAKRVSGLQGDLGLLNDVTTAQELMGDLPAATEAGEDLRRGATIMQGWLARMVAENERRLSREVARFLEAKPFWKRSKKRRGDVEPIAAGE